MVIMDLTSIQDPSFLKRMSVPELEALGADIRRFLIEKLAETGGHLGPNLGVVELTLALHRVFDSPKDQLVWDVGHQAYVHKILTGRTSQFDTLRQYNGLCGFPKRCESDHDVWETGHSSTSLSAAMGIAIANELKGRTNDRAIAIIGDGALTGGMALEALNHIGAEKQNVIVILNDNEMSIAPNVGAMHNMLGRMRSSRKLKHAREEVETLIKHIPIVGNSLERSGERVKDMLKSALIPGRSSKSSASRTSDRQTVMIYAICSRRSSTPRKSMGRSSSTSSRKKGRAIARPNSMVLARGTVSDRIKSSLAKSSKARSKDRAIRRSSRRRLRKSPRRTSA